MKNAVKTIIPYLLAALFLLGGTSALAQERTWVLSPEETTAKYEMTTFDEALPRELAAAMAKTDWADWQCLKGIRQIESRIGEAGMRSGAAMAVVQKNGQTMLLHFYNSEGKVWKCLPAAEEKALLSGRDFTFDAGLDRMYPTVKIVYPMKDGGREVFDLSLSRYVDKPIAVLGYRREAKDGSALIIGGGKFGNTYFCVEKLSAAGKVTFSKELQYYYPRPLEDLDADRYPKSLEEVRGYIKDHPQAFLKEYGFLSGTNMRQKTSSQSKKLGVYNAGTLAKILGTEPGKIHPWYKVQVGQTVGYISEPYLHTASKENGNYWYFSTPLPVAKTIKTIDLKVSPGSGAKTVAALEKGTQMQVLANCDGWLHVCISSGELGYWMDVEGTFGYLRTKDVLQAATPLQLKYSVK